MHAWKLSLISKKKKHNHSIRHTRQIRQTRHTRHIRRHSKSITSFSLRLVRFVALSHDFRSCTIFSESCDVKQWRAIAFRSTWDSNSLSRRERRKECERRTKRDFVAIRKRERKIAFDDVRRKEEIAFDDAQRKKRIAFDDVRKKKRKIALNDVIVVDSKTSSMTRNSNRSFVCERIRLRRRRRLHIWLMSQNTKNEFFTNHFSDYISFLQSCNDNWCRNFSEISTSRRIFEKFSRSLRTTRNRVSRVDFA